MLNLILGLGLLLASIAISHLNLRLLLRLTRGPLIRYLLWPGVAVHEFGHLMMCTLTGTRVVTIRTFLKDGGEVIHERPSHHLIQLLISIGPLITGFLALMLLAYALVPELLLLEGQPFAILAQSLRVLIGTADERETWVFLLLLLSIAPTLAPSKEDFSHALPGLLLLSIGGGAVIFLIWFIAPGAVRQFELDPQSFLGPLWLLLVLEAVILGIVSLLRGGRLVTRR